MKSNSFTDFILCTTSLIVAVAVAVLAAINIIEVRTALVFLSVSIALIGMSLLDVETSFKSLPGTRKKSSKRRK